MLDAEALVCTDCGNVHMEGGVGPGNVDDCAVCGGDVAEPDLDDIIGL
jgi:hypothetical protein